MNVQHVLVLSLCVVSWPAAGIPQWLQSFSVDAKRLATVGENPYFILKPGSRLTLEGKGAAMNREKLVITVLDETATIDGIATRVVEERETKGDRVVEVSRNYFAINPQTGDVYYFGEDVDMYDRGKVKSHDGAWRHGSGSAKFGLMMPGKPSIGLRYYQELAPKIAMDRAEILSVNEKVTTPAGTFDRCLKTKETTPLEVFNREYKLYAPGIGLIKDGSLELTSKDSGSNTAPR